MIYHRFRIKVTYLYYFYSTQVCITFDQYAKLGTLYSQIINGKQYNYSVEKIHTL